MPYPRYKTVPFPVFPKTDILKGVAMPSYPQFPYAPRGPELPYYWVKGGPPKQTVESNLVDYNNPYEINSLADIVLSTFNPSMQHTKFYGLENIPLLNIIPDTIGLVHKTTVRPLLKGDWTALALNNLVNFSETMDIVANPFKGMLMEGDQGILNALGYGGQGRRNYDWDTGHIVTDMIAEVITDPLNWVTLFTKTGVTLTTKGSFKAAVKKAAGEAGEKFAKEVGQEFADKTFSKIARNAVRAYLNGDTDTMYKAMRSIADNYTRKNIIRFKNVLLPGEVYQALKNAEDIVMEWMSATNIKVMQSLIAPVEKFETALFKAAFGTPGIMPTWWALGRGATWIADSTARRARAVFKRFENFNGDISVSNFDEALQMWEDTYGKMNVALDKLTAEQMSSAPFVVLMHEEAMRDVFKVKKLFQDNWDDPKKLQQLFARHLKQNHNADGLTSFYRTLNDLNRKTNNSFEDILAYYKSFEDQLRVKLHHAQIEDFEAKIKIFRDYAYTHADFSKTHIQALVDKANAKKLAKGEHIKETYETVLHDMLKDFIPKEPDDTIFAQLWKAFSPNARGYTDMAEEYNVAVTLEFVQKSFERTQHLGFDPEDIAKAFKKQFTSWQDSTVVPMFRRFEEVAAKDPSGVMQLTVDKLKAIRDEYFKEMAKQFRRIKDVLSETGSLPELDFNPKHTMERFYSALNEAVDLYDDKFATFKLVMPGPTHQNLLKWAEKSTKATGGLLDKIMQDKIQVLKKSLGFKDIDVGKVKAMQEALINFLVDVSEWFHKSIVDVDYKGHEIPHFERLFKAIQNFTTTDTTDLYKYLDAWNDLDRELHMLPAYLKVLLDMRGEVKAAFKTADSIPSTPAQLTKLTNQLNKLQEGLQEINPLKYITDDIEIKSSGIMLNFKLEQTYTSLVLMSNEPFTKLITDIHHNTGLGIGIKNLANAGATPGLEDASRICQEIITMAQNYQNYLDLLTDLTNAPIQNTTRVAFLSSIQNYAMQNPLEFFNNYDYYFKQISERVEDFINTVKMKRSLSLDQFKNSLEDYIKEYLPDFKQHTAASDIDLLELVINQELADEFSNPFHLDIIMDIETSGLNSDSDTIFEIGAKHKGTTETRVYKQRILETDTVNIPQTRMLNKRWPGLPESEQLKKFHEDYSVGKTEKELLEDMLADLRETVLKNPDKQIRLVFHNGDKFDVDFIRARLKANGLGTAFFDELIKVDTYKLLKQKEGYYTLSSVERANLYHIFKQYTERMTKNTSAKLIDPSNGGLARNFSELGDILQNAAAKKQDALYSVLAKDQELWALGSEFRAYANIVWDQLAYISRTNKYMQWLMLDSDWIKSVDGQKFFYDYVQTFTGLSYPEIIEIYGEYLNPSKMLYALSDGVNYIGYKNAIDFEKLLEYFTFKEGDKINPKLAKSLTNVARSLDRSYAKIKNPAYLQAYSTKIKESLQAFIAPDMARKLREFYDISKELTTEGRYLEDALKKGDIDGLQYQAKLGVLQEKWAAHEQSIATTPLSFFNHFRTDKADTKSDWVILQYLYNVHKHRGTLTEYIDQLDPDVVKLLDKPEIITNKAFRGREMSALDAPLVTRIDDTKAKPADWAAATAQAKQDAESMLNLAREQDAYGLFRPKTQALSAGLMDVHRMLEVFDSIMNKLSPKKQHIFKAKCAAYGNNLDTQSLFNILTLDSATLRDHMAYRAWWFEFDVNDYSSNPHMKTAITNLLGRTNELKQLGIDIDADGTRYIIHFNKTVQLDAFTEVGETIVTINGDKISRPILKELDLRAASETLDNSELADALDKARQAIHRLAGDVDSSTSEAIGSVGDLTTKDFYYDLYKRLPEAVRSNMPDIEWMTNDKFFKRPRFNFTNFGTLATRQSKQPFGYNTIVSLYQHSATNTAVYAKTKVQYAQLFYNSDLSINVGWMKDAPDEDIIKMFREHPEYVLSALVEDKKRGYKIIRINPKNAQDVADARRLHAVLMDYQTFSTAYETINYNMHGEGTLKLWNRFIYLYKVGYLFDLGVWLRNYVDSTLKTMNETGEFSGTLKAQYDAMRLLHKYNQCADYIMNMDPQKRFRASNAEIFFNDIRFEKVHYLDKDTYDFVHAYMFDGPSAGLSGRWAKYYEMARHGEDDLNSMWETVVHLTRKTMLPNQYVEQVNRLAEYIILAQRGLTNAEAFQKIAKTHFDYAVKSNFEQMMEVVFPFYTFISRNLTYWVNAIQEHPWIASLYEDIMTPVWNFDDISYEELSRNRSLQYQVLAGNIPLNDKGMTLKLSPSFMDVYGLFTQPIEFVTNKLAAPFKAVLDIGLQNNINKLSKWAQATMNISSQYQPQPPTGFLEQYSEFIPILGTLFQRYGEMGPTYFNRTGNILNKILPGIFGATQRWGDYQFKQGSRLKQVPRQYQSSFSRNTPSFHRAYAKKTYAKKIYAKKTYAKKTYAKQYYPNYYNKIPRYESFYKKHYTKQGKSRLKQMMLPVTGYSLHYKLKNLFRYMR